MISSPSFSAMTIPQTQTFASMARDLALFEQHRALTDRILADQRRQELKPCPEPVALVKEPGLAA
jgi:hypothetical protein